MAKGMGAVVIDPKFCKGCSLCVAACPTKTLVLSSELGPKGSHYAEMATDTCTGCTICTIMCPDAAITVYKTRKQTSS